MAVANNFPKCYIGDIISPSQYNVVSTLEEHVKEVKDMEKELTKTMNEISEIPSDYSLLFHKEVAVKSRKECGTWVRGEIKCRLEDGTYKIFLIDYGVTYNEQKKNIRIILNPYFFDIEPLSFELWLYGILPLLESRTIENQITNNWENRAFDLVNSIFANISLACVKKIYILDRVVFGDIFVCHPPNSEEVSLRKLLINSKCAIYSEQAYREKVMGMEFTLKISQDFEFASELLYDSVSSDYSNMSSLTQPDLRKAENFRSESSNSNLDSVSPKSLGHVRSKDFDYDSRKKYPDYFSRRRRGNILPAGCSFSSRSGEHHSANLPSKQENSARKSEMSKYAGRQIEKTESNDIQQQGGYEKNHDKSDTNAELTIGCSNVNDHLNKSVKHNEIEIDAEINDSRYEIVTLKKLKDSQRRFSLITTLEEFCFEEYSSEDSDDSEEFIMYLDEDDQIYENPDSKKEDDYNLKVFVLFRDSKIEPVDLFKNLSVSSDIIMKLEKIGSFKHLTYIQRWAMPSILRGHSMVIIGPNNSGKSISYLVALSELLQMELYAEKINKALGPLLIILCSDSENCEYLYMIIHLLLGEKLELKKGYRNVYVRCVHGQERERDKWIHLTNGCDVLVTTPHCLLRLLHYRLVTTLNRVEYLVVDDAHILSEEPFLSQMKIILERVKLQQRHCQTIICGTKWNPEVSKLSQIVTKPSALAFGSHLEAAIYAKLEPQVFLLENHLKINKIYELIGNKIGKRKILIACEDKIEVLLLDKTLKEKGHTPMIAHSGLLAVQIKEFREKWKRSKVPQICIFSDDILPELLIYDAELLVHYTLPYKSKSDFAYRFSTLTDNYENHLNTENPEEKLDVIIFLDDQDHIQLPHVVEFIIRLGGKVPESAMHLSQEIKVKIELNKKDMLLCQDLFKFGKCYRKKNCEKRHAIIKEIDCIENPIKGWVKFDIKEVHDVVHLSVRLIENCIDGKIKEIFDDLTSKIANELEQYYGIEENRKSPDTIERMDMYAVDLTKINKSTIFRAKVIEHISFDDEKKPEEVRIKLVDVGSMMIVSVSVLYELPEILKKYPPQTIDVYLCNFFPRDFDHQWSKAAIDISRALYLTELQSNQSWIGKVVLSLKDSLLIDTVKKFQFLRKINANAIDTCVKAKLLSEGIVEINEEHLKNLALLCKNADIVMECKFENRENEVMGLVSELQWSYFDKNVVNVHFLCAENTSSLFVRLSKYEDLLVKLECDCQEEAKELIAINATNVNNYEIATSYQIGSYCLALHGDRWQRARIESEANNNYTVYFIDYGDFYTTENILPISKKLLHQLPAQAIECSLSGIKHDIKCSPKVLDEIYAYCDNGKADLFVHVLKPNLKPQVTKENKYGINLLNAQKSSLNEILIDSGLMKPGRDVNVLCEKNTFILLDTEDNEELKPLSNHNFSLNEDTTDENLCICGDVVEKPECSQWLSDLNIDLLEDENAESYLQDFLDQAFPQLENSSISSVSEEAVGIKMSDISESQPSLKAHNKSESSTPDFVIKTYNKNTLAEVTCYTPQVLWSQTGSEIKLRIMLNNVSSYKLNCTARNILFRCLCNEKLYVVDLKLFGTICAELTDVQPKAFFVQILLKKLCIIEWPRLHAGKMKFQWIKFDVESAFGSETSYNQNLYKKKNMPTKPGITKTKSESHTEINLTSSSSEGSDSGSETSCDSESTTE